MGSRNMLMNTAMVALLALPLAACSSSMRLKSARMCQAAGGTYSGNTCNPGKPNAKSATQMCMAHGGVYIVALDMCEMHVRDGRRQVAAPEPSFVHPTGA